MRVLIIEHNLYIKYRIGSFSNSLLLYIVMADMEKLHGLCYNNIL